MDGNPHCTGLPVSSLCLFSYAANLMVMHKVHVQWNSSLAKERWRSYFVGWLYTLFFFFSPGSMLLQLLMPTPTQQTPLFLIRFVLFLVAHFQLFHYQLQDSTHTH